MNMPELEHMITRVVGGGEPEIGCDECFAELDRYVELELAGVEADAGVPGMRAHLVGCPACREDYESLGAFVKSRVSRR